MTEEKKPFELEYRPLSFDELIGFKKEKESLLSIINTKRTYLLYGKRGCGKTTIGRLIAYELDIKDIDIIEIDAATNRGIDDAKAIKQNASFSPLSGKHKIYIIDEAHQLTGAAFDALLKTLEEPPKHCYFVLCSSEVDKIPTTIKSRCSKYEVNPLSNEESEDLLNWIIKEEKLTVSKEVITAIIDKNEGVPREMLVSLDMIKSMKNNEDAISLIYAASGNAQVIELCRALLAKKDWKTISQLIKDIKEEPESIRYAVMGYMSAVLLNGDNKQAALVMMEFSNTFMYSKKPGLVLACYMVIKG